MVERWAKARPKVTPKVTPKGRPKGARASAGAQLSEEGRKLLVWLMFEELRLSSGTPEEKLAVRNTGVPWNLAAAAEALKVLPASAKRTLSGLERRQIICCWATGEGRGRRISHIKLSAQANEIARHQHDHGMSAAQFTRKKRSLYAEQQRIEWEDEMPLASEPMSDVNLRVVYAELLASWGASPQNDDQAIPEIDTT